LIHGNQKQFTLDTAVCRGQPERAGHETKTLRIRFAKVLDISALTGWLEQKIDINASVLEAVTFFDHLLREMPSRTLIKLKRSFFPPQHGLKDPNRFNLGFGVQAVKGIFMSLKPVLTASLTPGLAVNLDVANSCFWEEQELKDVMMDLLQPPSSEFSHVQRMFQESDRSPQGWKRTRMYNVLKRLRRLAVIARYRDQQFRYIIADWEPEDPGNLYFTRGDKRISVAEHMRTKWDFTPMRWVPTIKTSKGSFVPIDSVRIEANQRYNFKLGDRQTAEVCDRKLLL